MKNVIQTFSLFLLAMVFSVAIKAAGITGPTEVCALSGLYYYSLNTTPANGCSVSWSSSHPGITVITTPTWSSTNVSFSNPPNGNQAVTLTAVVTCPKEGGKGTTSTSYNIVVVVKGVGPVSLVPSIPSIPCNRSFTYSFQVSASASQADSYEWTVSGGTFTPTTGSQITITKPECGTGITVTCKARRSDCGTNLFTSTSIVVPVATVSLPTAINGPDALCGTGANSSAVYTVDLGHSCALYNWYFDPPTSAITISNPNSGAPTLSASASSAEGYKYLHCSFTACGQTTTLHKRITVCQSVATPTNVWASQLGNTCYYKFEVESGCAESWEWDISGFPPFSTTLPELNYPFDPGIYTVKVRAINGCGTSAYFTKSFNLPVINNNPPCMYKTRAEVEEAYGFKPATQKLSIYPNPSNGMQAIKIVCDESLLGGSLQIIDISGKSIYAQDMNRLELQLLTQELGRGIYFCVIQKGDTRITQKFVIEN